MDLAEEIRNIKSSEKELRRFGWTLGIFLAGFAGFVAWRHKLTLAPLIAASVFFIFFAVVLPKALRPIQKAWMTVAMLVGWVMTRVLLSVFYYLVLSPIAWIRRCTSKQTLDLKYPDPSESFWIERDHEQDDKKRYETQY